MKERSNLRVCWLLLCSIGKWTACSNARSHVHAPESSLLGSGRGVGFLILKINCHKSKAAPRCPGSSFSMNSSSRWHINSNFPRRRRVKRNINTTSFIWWFSSVFQSLHGAGIGDHKGCPHLPTGHQNLGLLSHLWDAAEENVLE